MILDRLRIRNFGVYAGESEFEFTPLDGRPITLIGGLNGGGKTTLMDAIQLVIYGKRARCSNRGALGYDEFLSRSISHGASDREASLRLEFRADASQADSGYALERTWTRSTRSVRERLRVWRDGREDPLLADNWDAHVEEFFPLAISPLFFFDGEQIEALADPLQSQRIVATAVESLLGLGLLDRLSQDLTALERRKQAEQLDDDARVVISELEDEYARLGSARQDALQERAAANTARERAAMVLENAEERFASEGGELADQQGELEAERRRLSDRQVEINDDIRRFLAGSLPLALIEPLLGSTLEQATLEQDSAAGELLASVLDSRDREVLDVLSAATEDSAAVELIGRHLDADRSERIARSADVTRYLDVSVGVVGALEHLVNNGIDSAKESTGSLLEDAAGISDRLVEMDRALASIPPPDQLDPVREALANARVAMRTTEAAVEACDVQLVEAERLHEQGRRELARVLKDNAVAISTHQDAARVVSFSERARSTLSDFRDRLLDNQVASIGAAITDGFRELLHKETLVHEVRLDREQFTFELVGESGAEPDVGRLSAGERQLFAVATLWALARVSGRELPVVIDTPLGRLDGEHRRLLVERYFPRAGNQVILLSTDEEIDAELVDLLAPSIGHAYSLQYSDETQSTTVVDGYLPGVGERTEREVSHVA